MWKFLEILTVGGLAVGLAAVAARAGAQSYELGRAALPAEIAAWDIDVRPDGTGLPAGSGDVETGEVVFAEKCASCHGDFGEGVDRWPVLAGGLDTLTEERPVKTIGSYWPYLSTVWDYVHRAMPFGDAQSLADDEVYAITAYLLYSNGVVEDDFVLSDANFADVTLPNAAGFFSDDRKETSIWKSPDRCMEDCKPAVKITGRARILDVTPDQGGEGAATMEDSHGEADGATEAASAEPVQIAAAPAIDPMLVTAGKMVFKKCAACHAVGDGATHKVGPHLNGVFGRNAGGAAGFRKYSKTMRKAGEDGMVWTDGTMAAYLANPRAMIKGTRMAFAGLKKQQDIDAVIAYLKQASE